MSYFLEYSSLEHHSMLATTLSTWANCHQDIYILSTEGHRVYTSHTLLAFSSPNFLAHILPSSTETAISLPFSSQSLNVLFQLLSKGIAYSDIAVDKAEVEEAALCLGIHLQLQETSNELLNKNVESNNFDPTISSTFYMNADHEEKIHITENVLDNENSFPDSLGNGSSIEDVLDIKVEEFDNKVDIEEVKGMQDKVSHEKYSSFHICEFCNKIYENKKYLRYHKIKHHPNQGSEGDIRCKYCPRQFNKLRMYRHVQVKHRNVLLSPETYKYDPDDGNNISEDESKKNQCNFCPQIFMVDSNLRRHKNIFHPGMMENGDVSCKYCAKIFSKVYINKHIKSKHPNAPFENIKNIPDKQIRTYKCKFCPKHFTRKVNVRLHKKRHHPKMMDKGDVSCEYCGKIFNKGKMFRHVNAKHPNQSLDTNKSIVTEKAIKKVKKENIKNEIRKITPNLSQSIALRHHEEIAYKEPIQDPLESYNSIDLENPPNDMTNEDKSTNVEIMNIHSEKKPIAKCTYCPKSFANEFYLWKHIKNHHPDDITEETTTGSMVEDLDGDY